VTPVKEQLKPLAQVEKPIVKEQPIKPFPEKKEEKVIKKEEPLPAFVPEKPAPKEPLPPITSIRESDKNPLRAIRKVAFVARQEGRGAKK